MKITKTKFDGLLIIETDKFDDERGYLSKFFDKEFFAENGINFNLTQVKYTFTKSKGTIRGMHFQKKPFEEDKIIHCTRGEIFEVAVDLRKRSKTYGKWFGMSFSQDSNKSILIPKSFAHGYQALTDNCEMLYLMTGKFSKNSNAGCLWNDPFFNIGWPLKPTVIAEKDNSWAFFKK